MAEIRNINNRVVPAALDQEQIKPAGSPLVKAPAPGEGKGPAAPFTSPDAPIGQPGPLGQPTGMPAPTVPGQTQVLPDVLLGRDPSQLIAAERLREAGGASVTDELLGLNLQPTIIGFFSAPPGNSEALRHMTPTMKRTIVRTLLTQQRQRMRRLAHLLRREHHTNQEDAADEGESQSFSDAILEESLVFDEAQRERAHHELSSAARMLDLLDEMLAMQDYTLSQMGTFSQG